LADALAGTFSLDRRYRRARFPSAIRFGLASVDQPHWQTQRLPQAFFGVCHLAIIAFVVEAVFHPVAYHLYFFFIAGLAVALKAIYDAGPDARQELVGSTARGRAGMVSSKYARRRPGTSAPR